MLGVSPQLGTIDNANVVEEDFNDVDVQGGRIAAKWFVNDEWSVTGAYLYQKTESSRSQHLRPDRWRPADRQVFQGQA